MTYGNPSIASAIESLAEQNVQRLLVLPLYPQYCSSTTGSVFDRTSRSAAALALAAGDALRERLLCRSRLYRRAERAHPRSIGRDVGERSHLVFSYHGMPAVLREEGDPYQAQAEATTRSVVSRLELASEDWSHCYQSRFGRVVWLQPYTEDTLKDWPARHAQS